MAFVLPEKLHWREEAELKRICLVQLYRQNITLFRAVAIVVYGEFGRKKREIRDDFDAYCGWLAMALLDPVSGGSVRGGDLSREIWRHLLRRNVVSGYMQNSIDAATPIYTAFAHFIALETFKDGDPGTNDSELDEARQIIAEIRTGQRMVEEVPLPGAFGRKGQDSCEE